MDVFTRGIRGWHLGRSVDQGLTLQALDRALMSHMPEIQHSEEARAHQSCPSGGSLAKWRGFTLDAHHQRRGG
jgi:hypothetical protein